MTNEEHLKILKQGVTAWKKWRADHMGEVPDLSGAYPSQVRLIAANLRSANLDGASSVLTSTEQF